jgi:glycosyltransferase involved in cell wall biosynthesis
MKLSILTPTIPGRENQVKALSEKLAKQIGDLPVEHLVFSDNRKRSIGEKRQALIDIANGEYVSFCDDDDDVSDDYVSEMLKAIKTRADVITFRQRAIYNGLESEIVFGLNNKDEKFAPNSVINRAPWHICAWKRDRIKDSVFAFVNYHEDRAWSMQARKKARTGYHIDKVLHTYRHDASTTAAPEPVCH